MPRKLTRYLPSSFLMPAIALIGLVAIWEICVREFRPPSYILPAPSTILAESWAQRAIVLGHALATLKTVMLAFFVSIAISFPLAVLINSSKIAANVVYPLLVITQSVPKVALAPILVIVAGAGELSRVTIAVLVAFFPLAISIATGLSAVPKELIDLGRSFKATRMQELFLIRLPFSVPFVFSGLKLAITFALVGAVVAEFVAAERGLGYQILSATAFFKTPVAFGALVILSLLGIVLFQAIVVIERSLFPWAVGDESGK
jgi:NitT/TauT family transport system permease protein